MSSTTFFESGMDSIKTAIAHEKKGNYASAIKFFRIGVRALESALKNEKMAPRIKHITSHITTYTDRADQLEATAPLCTLATNNPSIPAFPKDTKKEKGGDVVPGNDANDDAIGMFDQYIVQGASVTFDGIAGLADCKQSIADALILPRKFPNTYKANNIDVWNGVLLYGPPGTGKTELARAVATEIKSTFFSIRATAILDKFVGESEKHVKLLFQAARKRAPSVIFIDEAEALMSERSGQGDSPSSNVNDRIITEFLQCMDGIGSSSEGVFVLAATNYPERIDNALRRRFQKRIYVPLPDLLGRGQLLKIKTAKLNHSLSDEDYANLATETDGYSGADIATVVNDAKLAFMRRYQAATHVRMNEQQKYVPCESTYDGALPLDIIKMLDDSNIDVLPMCISDIRESLSRNKPSTSAEGNAKYLKFSNTF